MSQENVELAKQAYDDFTNGKMDDLRGLMANDAEWLASAELPAGGLTQRADAIMEAFATKAL